MSADQSLKRRIAGVDSIRAFAALSVMLAHILGPVMPNLLGKFHIDLGSATELSRYLFTGHPAVIVFFVVSGFCIHFPYTNNKLPIPAFWAARWTRIMIPVLVAIVLAKLAHVSKYNFWDGFILWSIVCELVYYTLYPAFYYLARYISWTTQFCIALVISFALVNVLGTNQYGNAHIYGPFVNWAVALPSWLIGCVLAEQIAMGNYPAIGDVVRWRILVAFVASLLFWLTRNTSLGYYLTMNVFSLLIYFWLSVEIYSARFGSVSRFEAVGKWSYSIYLFHAIVFRALITQLHMKDKTMHRFWAVPIVLFGCYLAYLLVEKKSHEYARALFKRLRENPRWVLQPAVR